MRVSRWFERAYGAACPLFTRVAAGWNCHCLKMCLHWVEIRPGFGPATAAFIFPAFVSGRSVNRSAHGFSGGKEPREIPSFLHHCFDSVPLPLSLFRHVKTALDSRDPFFIACLPL